jgi:hypothetical protein
MIILGIDPGKHGGLVALSKEREILLEEVMPEDPLDTYSILRAFKKEFPSAIVFLEESHPRPTNGVKAIHTYAFHNGQIDMILKILELQYELIHPHIWCRHMHVGTSADRPKERSRQVVQQLFPDVRLINPNTPRARTMHEGLMDALLIAEFGLRKLSIVQTRHCS